MTHHFENLTAGYALHALEPNEELKFTRHLQSCPECTGEVASFEEVLAEMASGAAVEAPASLKGSVMSRLDTTLQLRPVIEKPKRFKKEWFALAAAGAGILALGGVLGQSTVPQGDLLAGVEDSAHKRSVSVPLSSGNLEVSYADGTGIVRTEGVDALPAGKGYQVWSMTDNGAISLGVMQSKGSEYWLVASNLQSTNAIAVTVEDVGGSVNPSSAAVAMVSL